MQQVLSFARRPTSVNIVVNTGGSVLNVLFGALIHFLLFRMMTPVEYGVLTIWLSLAYVLSTMLDFGTTATIYAYLPPLLKARGDDLFDFVKSLFAYQLGLATAAAAVLLAAFPLVDHIFLKTGAPYSLIAATVCAIFFFIVQNLVTNMLYASRDFVRVNMFLNISNFLKVLLLLILIPLNKTDTTSIFTVITIGGSILFFIPIFFSRGHLLKPVWGATFTKKALRLRYTFTYLVATQIFNLGQRMDLFLLSYFGLQADAGYYAAAQKILLSITSAVISVTQVLSPQFSHVKKRRDIHTLAKQTLLYLSAPAILFGLLTVTPQFVFEAYLEKFSSASIITRQLAPAYVLYTYASFVLLFLLYSVKKPGAILTANILFFLVMTIGCFTMIPTMKLAAIAPVVFGSMVLATTVLSIYAFYEYQKLPA